jgi:hypothetical protein
VIAELDWIIAVTPAPTKNATMGLLVIDSRIFLSFWPATLFRPSDIKTMPKRNNPNPPMVIKIIFLITVVPYNEGYKKLQVTENRL